jgi:hypothetical protein
VIYSIKNDDNSGSSSNEYRGAGIDVYKNTIFYEVVAKDFNQNNLLDTEDPTYLYVSDRMGNNFRRISPDDYNISSWEVVKGTSKVLLQAQKDVNGDKKFDQNDPVIPLIVDLSTGKLATETFRQDYIDSLKVILTNTWKPKKK